MSVSSELPRLLLIESDELLTDLISFRLELLGYCVATAASAAEAKRQLISEKIDLVLIDLEMDGGDAADFVSQLRADEETASMPIIILSATSAPEQVRAAHRTGANAYVVMPYDPAVLEQKIEQLLDEHESIGV